jgi:hypothetical protein
VDVNTYIGQLQAQIVALQNALSTRSASPAESSSVGSINSSPFFAH